MNEKLNHDPEHPGKLRARLPAHEIETLIEKSVRDQIQKLCGVTPEPILDHVLKFQHEIPTYELIRTCVKRVTMYFDQIQIEIKSTVFPKLVDKHLGVSVTGIAEISKIIIPYQTKRVKDGAVIIEPKGRDIFDLPPSDIKRLVQGVVWRDEHFSGTKMSDIAKREGYSGRYIRKVIMRSFNTLLSA